MLSQASTVKPAIDGQSPQVHNRHWVPRQLAADLIGQLIERNQTGTQSVKAVNALGAVLDGDEGAAEVSPLVLSRITA
jgi:hypothetical protein